MATEQRVIGLKSPIVFRSLFWRKLRHNSGISIIPSKLHGYKDKHLGKWIRKSGKYLHFNQKFTIIRQVERRLYIIRDVGLNYLHTIGSIPTDNYN